VTVTSPLRIVTLSDANLANLAAALRADGGEPALEVTEGAPGSLFHALMDASAPVWQGHPDLAVVWTRPEGVLPSFADALAGKRVEPRSVIADAERFANSVAAVAARARWVLVPTWVPTFAARGLGLLDLHDPSGLRALLAQANDVLAERLRATKGCFVADASTWFHVSHTDRKLHYAAKIPFPTAVFQAAARDIRALLTAASGRSRKIIILDLDNTLWGGVVGETGWEGLRLGGHDPVGEAFVDFQYALKALSARGIVLAVVSKNEESVALEAIRSHPEMVLREDDFAGWRINWNDKGMNVASLLEELRLGADAAVFLDDQPAERARVAQAVPGVLVPEWPADGLRSAELLDRLACFDQLVISEEDVLRTKSYIAERKRDALRETVGSAEEWLAELGVRVEFERLGPKNLARAAQLLNKTNQMNLRTRRLSESELADWTAGVNRSLLVCRVSDRFSDFGLTGLVSVEVREGEGEIVDFLLSCRVMSRKVEETLLAAAAREASARGATTLRAEFIATPRNAPMLAFLRGSDLAEGEEHRFQLSVAERTPFPAHLTVEGPTS